MTVRDMETIYQVPLLLEEQGLLHRITEALMLDRLTLTPNLISQGSTLWELWKKTVVLEPHLEPVNIALVGKYIALPDSKCFHVFFVSLYSRKALRKSPAPPDVACNPQCCLEETLIGACHRLYFRN